MLPPAFLFWRKDGVKVARWWPTGEPYTRYTISTISAMEIITKGT
uniref:Uncharacterized protein n=1 Tax=Ackermannviridae sp. TaxID=2831612 RepID=A0A8S5VVR6_9CAUD|nr:MAG TPA: hypothetical protein [Ackermannviridae sp.]